MNFPTGNPPLSMRSRLASSSRKGWITGQHLSISSRLTGIRASHVHLLSNKDAWSASREDWWWIPDNILDSSTIPSLSPRWFKSLADKLLVGSGTSVGVGQQSLQGLLDDSENQTSVRMWWVRGLQLHKRQLKRMDESLVSESDLVMASMLHNEISNLHATVRSDDAVWLEAPGLTEGLLALDHEIGGFGDSGGDDENRGNDGPRGGGGAACLKDEHTERGSTTGEDETEEDSDSSSSGSSCSEEREFDDELCILDDKWRLSRRHPRNPRKLRHW